MKKSYIVLSQLELDGRLHPVDSTIDLAPEAAAYPLARGAIAPAPAQPITRAQRRAVPAVVLGDVDPQAGS
ncbi:MAG: hypothetical protein AB7I35_12280 [Ramlibacter sp.]